MLMLMLQLEVITDNSTQLDSIPFGDVKKPIKNANNANTNTFVQNPRRCTDWLEMIQMPKQIHNVDFAQKPRRCTDWRGKPWTPTKCSTPAAHPNSRLSPSSPSSSSAQLSEWQDPLGVPHLCHDDDLCHDYDHRRRHHRYHGPSSLSSPSTSSSFSSSSSPSLSLSSSSSS